MEQNNNSSGTAITNKKITDAARDREADEVRARIMANGGNMVGKRLTIFRVNRNPDVQACHGHRR